MIGIASLILLPLIGLGLLAAIGVSGIFFPPEGPLCSNCIEYWKSLIGLGEPCAGTLDLIIQCTIIMVIVSVIAILFLYALIKFAERK